MNRLSVIAITAPATLAVAAGTLSLVFTIRPAMGDEGYLLLRGKEAKECSESNCAVMSEREFQAAMLKFLTMMQQRQGKQGPDA